MFKQMQLTKDPQIPNLALNAILVLLFTVLFLFSPQSTDKNTFCGEFVPLNNVMGYYFHCDSHSYIEPAENLKILLEKESPRQSRPIYIATGAMLGHLIGNVFGTYDKNTFYQGFILLNFIIIITYINIYSSILSTFNVNKYLIYMSSIYIICNDTVRFYLWGATPQLFSILTPLLSIYIGLTIIKNKIISIKYLIYYSLSCGLLPLLYGNFIIICFIILIAAYYNLVVINKLSLINIFKYGFSIFIFFLLPSVIWIIIAIYFSGGYFNAEVSIFREFVWISDAIKNGNLITEFIENTIKYLSTFIVIDIIPFFFLSIILCKYLNIEFNFFKKFHLDKYPFYLLTISVILYLFFFFWILGYYAPRLTFTMVPPLVLFITLSINLIIKSNQLNMLRWYSIMAMITLLWCCYHVVHPNPCIGPA